MPEPSSVLLQPIEALKRLAEPFDVALIQWRIIVTSRDGKKGLVAAYADTRAYADRLNDVLGPVNWTQEYAVYLAQNFEREGKGQGSQGRISAKVMVVCKLTVVLRTPLSSERSESAAVISPAEGPSGAEREGWTQSSHSATGEQWADDENALTSADAQAFKRACACFGLGRYLYDVPHAWVELDNRKQIKKAPELPGWARPAKQAEGTGNREQGAEPSRAREQAGNGNQGVEDARSLTVAALTRPQLLEQVNALIAKHLPGTDQKTLEKKGFVLQRFFGTSVWTEIVKKTPTDKLVHALAGPNDELCPLELALTQAKRG